MADKTNYDKQMDIVRDTLKEEHDRQRREAKRQKQTTRKPVKNSSGKKKSASIWNILFG